MPKLHRNKSRNGLSVLRPTEQNRIYSDLKRRLQAGDFQAEGRLPSLRELARLYGSNSGTVHQAVGKLRQDRLLKTHHGRGTFVADPSEKTRQVLLLSRTEGHEWSDYMRAFSQAFSACPRTRLLIQEVPYGNAQTQEQCRAKVARMIDEGVDMVLFMGQGEHLEFLAEYQDRVPLVCFYGRDIALNWNCASVVSDWFHGGYAGISHLVSAGCRRIAVLVHTMEPHLRGRTLNEWVEGCESAKRENASPVQIELFHAPGNDPRADYFARFAEFLKERPDLDGVFGFADYVTAPLVGFLQKQGRRVPQDLAVLGYYDTPWAQTPDPPLSSISTQPAEMAMAVTAIYDTQQWQSHVVIKPRLVVRESTRR
jgi:DNA-binding LacI/PurR family transcriptional regulator